MKPAPAVPTASQHPPRTFDNLVAASAPARQVFAQARRLAATDLPLLLVGERGAGKRALAEAIHRASPRAAGPLISLRTAEVLDALHADPAGATARLAVAGGAVDRSGRAPGGTVVLRGFEDLLPAEQVRLQRGLARLGQACAGAERGLDARWIHLAEGSAEDLLRAGLLRRDVCQRVGLHLLFLPPLRERGGDLLPLLLGALASAGRDPDAGGLTADAQEVLLAYDFPGNVHELLTAVAEAAARAPAGPIGRRWLPPHLWRAGGPGAASPLRTLEEVEVEHIRRVLTHTHGNRSAAARILGITRVGLLGKLRRYGIDIPPQPAGARVA